MTVPDHTQNALASRAPSTQDTISLPHLPPSSPSSLSELRPRRTHDADTTVWCSTKFHDAVATNTTSPIVT
jgi:hypothetical protein